MNPVTDSQYSLYHDLLSSIVSIPQCERSIYGEFNLGFLAPTRPGLPVRRVLDADDDRLWSMDWDYHHWRQYFDVDYADTEQRMQLRYEQLRDEGFGRYDIFALERYYRAAATVADSCVFGRQVVQDGWMGREPSTFDWDPLNEWDGQVPDLYRESGSISARALGPAITDTRTMWYKKAGSENRVYTGMTRQMIEANREPYTIYGINDTTNCVTVIKSPIWRIQIQECAIPEPRDETLYQTETCRFTREFFTIVAHHIIRFYEHAF